MSDWIFFLYLTVDVCIENIMCLSQKSEAKMDEILKEIKSLKDLISSQEKRIIKLEEQMSQMAI